MAGTGFVIRKLSRQDNRIGMVQAYVIPALISAGPWLFTILALGTITVLSGRLVSQAAFLAFKTIMIYNLSFSLVLTAPIYMIVARFLADSIYQKDVSAIPGVLAGSIALLYLIEVPLVCLFYPIYATIPAELALAAICNFILISGIWLIMVFLTALKNRQTTTQAFCLGMTITGLTAGPLSNAYGAAGILNSFSLGLSIILAILFARILSEYPYPFRKPFAFLRYFTRYWEIAVSGLVYAMAIWVDKWVMWFAPEASAPGSHLVTYAGYDNAMFLAYLTVIPTIALFILTVETGFYEHYLKFYRDIRQQATYQQIQENRRRIVQKILSSARNILVLQGCICLIIILTAAKLFELMEINFTQHAVFRFGVLGAMFQAFSLFLLIILSYFDHRKATLLIQAIFLVTNIIFSGISLKLGFLFYGYGYFLASLVTFVCAALITITYLKNLIFKTFITENPWVAG